MENRKGNLKENDFVVVTEDLLPATEWCLGRVKNVIYHADQRVRVAEVLSSNGLIKRPIVKLYNLPIESNTPYKHNPT